MTERQGPAVHGGDDEAGPGTKGRTEPREPAAQGAAEQSRRGQSTYNKKLMSAAAWAAGSAEQSLGRRGRLDSEGWRRRKEDVRLRDGRRLLRLRYFQRPVEGRKWKTWARLAPPSASGAAKEAPPARPPRQLRAPSERSRESPGARPPRDHLQVTSAAHADQRGRRACRSTWSRVAARGRPELSRAAQQHWEHRREVDCPSGPGFCREGGSRHQRVPSKDSGRPRARFLCWV